MWTVANCLYEASSTAAVAGAVVLLLAWPNALYNNHSILCIYRVFHTRISTSFYYVVFIYVYLDELTG